MFICEEEIIILVSGIAQRACEEVKGQLFWVHYLLLPYEIWRLNSGQPWWLVVPLSDELSY